MADINKCETCESQEGFTASTGSCPLWMSDGRSFGDKVYNPRCQSQYQIQFDNQFQSNFEFRQFLMRNAEKIMQENALKASQSMQQ